MQKEIRGTGVALITPFYPDGTVDYDSLRTLVDFTVINGVDFIVALGTTAGVRARNFPPTPTRQANHGRPFQVQEHHAPQGRAG